MREIRRRYSVLLCLYSEDLFFGNNVLLFRGDRNSVFQYEGLSKQMNLSFCVRGSLLPGKGKKMNSSSRRRRSRSNRGRRRQVVPSYLVPCIGHIKAKDEEEHQRKQPPTVTVGVQQIVVAIPPTAPTRTADPHCSCSRAEDGWIDRYPIDHASEIETGIP